MDEIIKNKTPISAALGIGDILLLKMICDQYEVTNDIVLNINIINVYRDSSQSYLQFLKWLVEQLFTNNNIIYLNDPQIRITNVPTDKINTPSLSKYFNVAPFFDFKYIVFHTRCRMDTDTDNYFNIYKPRFKEFLSTFKSKYKIIILGERIISLNQEAMIHNIDCIYNELIVLKNNNDLIDMTESELCNIPNNEIFARDTRIIHNAESNLGLGFGGNFVIATALSKSFDFFVGKLSHGYLTSITKLKNKNYNLYDDVDKFIQCIATNY